MSNQIEYQDRPSAFQQRIQTFAVVNLNHIDIRAFLNDAFFYFKRQIQQVLEHQYLIKISACLKLNFTKTVVAADGTTANENQTIFIHTRTSVIDFESNLQEFYTELIVDYIFQMVDDVVMRGSGFTLLEINELTVQVNQFEPIAGATYIPTPKALQSKKAIVNVINRDNECFKYAVLSALYPANQHSERPNQYLQHVDKLNFNGIQYPVELKQITQFEKQNPTISINVYVFDEKEVKVSTLRLTKQVKENHIHLLMLTQPANERNEQRNMHYCWIKNLSRLLSAQMALTQHQKFICDRCLNHFRYENQLNEHLIDCVNQNKCSIQMPSIKSKKFKFENYKNQLKVPYVIYADIETMLEPANNIDVRPEGAKTTAYQHHVPYSIGYYFKCDYDDALSYYRSERNENCIAWFCKELYSIAQQYGPILDTVIPLEMSDENEVLFLMTDECEICGKPYTDEDIRVRDHSHLTGQYRLSAHAACNLNYKESKTIPIVFHNLTHYDSHFLIRELANVCEGSITAIALNSENYISFTKKISFESSNQLKKQRKKYLGFRFIDSFRFMASSLDSLATLLPPEKKTILQTECVKRGYDANQIAMLQKKAILCYDYIDSWSKLEQTQLPAKEHFYSILTESDITAEQYELVKQIWTMFKITSIGNYTDVYLMIDVLLLADVFENFRENCHKTFKLDPAHYFTAPGLSFDAMLRYTEVEIELITDIDMLMFVERGIRGGISQCSKRYAKANNKYVDGYDNNLESNYLFYLDANNLYGYAMLQYLPLSQLEWVDVVEVEVFNENFIMSIPKDSSIGYVFEVDLDYSDHSLHDAHQDYPFCPQTQIVPGTKNDQKLLSTVFDKEKYIIHYRMLQTALKNGLKLKKVYRAIRFHQAPWLAPYIHLCTEYRTQATNDFEKNFYKLMINAIYGKTLENLRNRVDIVLKTTWRGRYGAQKVIAMPNFKKSTIFAENLVAIELNKVSIYMNKPIIIGMTVLDLSKELMYDFHYNFMKPKYGKNIEILYTGKYTYTHCT